MKVLLMISAALILFAGCEYVPSIVYEIETTDGQILKLRCPLVDPYRSKLAYTIDSECRAIE